MDLERRIPAGHLLRRINPVVARILGELREKLEPFYSEIGRPSIDPELVKGEGFAVDASVMEADASRYHGKTPDQIEWAKADIALVRRSWTFRHRRISRRALDYIFGNVKCSAVS